MFFLLIMSSYGAHIIHANGIGKVSSAQNTVQYFVLVAALGIPEYGIREIAKCRDDIASKSTVFFELVSLNLLSSCACFIIYCLLLSYKGWLGDKELYVITGSIILFNIFNIDWLFQGEENYKYIAIRSIFIKCISLLLLFFLVNKESDYRQYAAVSVMALSGGYLLNIHRLLNHRLTFKLKLYRPKRHLKTVLLLLCTTVSIELYTLLDISMLTYFCKPENIGYYTMALRVPRIIIIAVTSISGVLLPSLSRYYIEGNIDKCNEILTNMFSILLFFFLPCGVGLIIVARSLITVLFGASFLPGISTLRIASLLIYALGFSNLFGTQALLTSGHEKQLFYCTLAGACSNILLNSVLIPLLAQNGAAIASVISETTVTVMTIFYSKKVFTIRINRRLIMVSTIACMLMALMCILALQCSDSDLIALVFIPFLGVIVYLGVSIILKNPVLDSINALKKT